jgi:ATP-dependent protease ClpP protease subunit
MLKEGHIFTDGVITKDYAKELTAQLASLPSDTEKIIHHITSGGGNVYAGYEGYLVLLKSGKPIKSIIEGQAQSMATFIALAGSEVEMMDPGVFMIHNPYFPDGVTGDADALDKAKEELRLIENTMAEAYAKKTKKPVDEIKAMMKKETRMSPQQAVKMGFVDKVLEPTRIAALDKLAEEFTNIKNEIMNLFKRSQPAAEGPKAVALNTNDGKVLNVQYEGNDNNYTGKPATIDGAPAQGTYTLADGTMVTCVGGVVTEVKAGTQTPPQETPDQKLQNQILQLQNQLTQLTTAKAAEEARVKAEQEAKTKAEELAKVTAEKESVIAAQAKEIAELKRQSIGDATAPGKGAVASLAPVGYGGKTPSNEAVMATRTLLADKFPWLERHYPNGKYSDGTPFFSYRSDGGPNAVSILETNLNYTWNGILSTDLFFKPTLTTPAISDVFNIDLGAADKKRYHIAPVVNKVLKPYTGCAQAPTGSSFDITSKAIQLKPFEMYEGWCKDDFTDQLTGSYNVLAQDWLKTGIASFDPAGTPIDSMITKLLKDSLRRDIWRRISFGDTTSSSADWNQIDGLWQSLIDQSGASNYCVYRSGAALGTGSLAADKALDYFKAIYKDSALLLKEYAIDSGNGRFLVTRSIWENYYDSLVAAGSVSEAEYNNLQTGISRLMYKGIPVVPITIWDEQLADSTNPLSATTRHLIAFTVKDNHVLGIENTSDMDKIDSWFEKKDNKRYYRSNMTMGFLGALHCELTSISY